MTGSLNMVKLEPDMPRLAEWAHARKLVKRGGDLGYALHALLKAGFGKLALQPFSLQQHRERTTLFGYTKAGQREMTDLLNGCADPAVREVLAPDSIAFKPMPTTWRSGQIFGFEVRVRPTIRQDADGRRDSTTERDAFLAACDRAPQETPISRQRVYGEWLAAQFTRHGGAELVERENADIRLAAFQRTRIARRDRKRRLREIDGPDATLKGLLRVTDSVAFAHLLARGIGRHRAFGFGMLLLRPPPQAWKILE